jgi:hypothetical protein
MRSVGPTPSTKGMHRRENDNSLKKKAGNRILTDDLLITYYLHFFYLIVLLVLFNLYYATTGTQLFFALCIRTVPLSKGQDRCCQMDVQISIMNG